MKSLIILLVLVIGPKGNIHGDHYVYESMESCDKRQEKIWKEDENKPLQKKRQTVCLEIAGEEIIHPHGGQEL